VSRGDGLTDAVRDAALMQPGAGMDRRLVTLFAVACGICAANLYYAQPLLERMGHDLHASPRATGLVVTSAQIGYALACCSSCPRRCDPPS